MCGLCLGSGPEKRRETKRKKPTLGRLFRAQWARKESGSTLGRRGTLTGTRSSLVDLKGERLDKVFAEAEKARNFGVVNI